MKTFLLLAAALVACATTTNTNKELTRISKDDTAGPGYTRVFSGYGQSGYFYDFTDYVPDLAVFNFDNMIRSSCVTGLWFYYEQVEYNKSPGSVTWMHGVEFCSDFQAAASDSASSLRYAGSPYGLNQDSFTLYEGSVFTGSEYFGQGEAYSNVEYMEDHASSVVITGVSPWTFYTERDYYGFSVCVYPNTDHDVGADGTKLDYGIFASITDTGLPDNSVNSVAKGCRSKNIVRAPKLEAVSRSRNGAMGVFKINQA